MASAIRAFLCRKICTFVYWCVSTVVYMTSYIKEFSPISKIKSR